MKLITAALQGLLDSRVYSFATCWKITRSDGLIFGFTDHDQDLWVSGVTYIAKTGYKRTAIESGIALAPDNIDVDSFVEDDSISSEDIRAGEYDNAEVEIFMVNHESPSDGIIILRKGNIGNITLQDFAYVVEIRGLAQRMTVNILELYMISCRAELADGRCQVNMSAFTKGGSVTDVVTDRRTISVHIPDLSFPLNYFKYGTLTWTAGNNEGRSMEIKSFSVAPYTLTLFLPMPGLIRVGDTFSIEAGCDKKFSTCRDRFNNVNNFRGEPYIPHEDTVMRFPDAK